MPSSPIAQNTDRQPKLCASQPISGAKATSEKYCALLKIAEAVPRSGPGNHAATSRALPGKDGASARPTRKRSTNSVATAEMIGNQPTKPCIAVISDHNAIAPA